MIVRTVCLIIVVFGGIICAAILISCLADRHEAIYGRPVIKFANFRKWYRIKPGAWELYDWLVLKKDLAEDDDDGVFRFSLADSIRYKLWLRERKKLATTKAESTAVRKLLESVQKDIEEYLEK